MIKYILINIFFSLNIVFSQCPSPKEILEKSFSFQSLDKSIQKKELINLFSLSCKCGHSRDSIAAYLLNKIGVLNYPENLPEAIKFTKFAVNINSKNIKEVENQFLERNYSNLGLYYYELKDNIIALKYYEKSVEIGKKNPFRYKIISSNLRTIGSIYFVNGDFRKAIDKGTKGEAYAKLLDNKYEIILNLREQARAYSQLGENTIAKLKIETAIKLAIENKLDSWEIAICYFTYANIINQIGLTNQALSYYEKSYKIFNSINNDEGKYMTSIDIGMIYYSKKDFIKAKLFNERAVKYANSFSSKIKSFNNLGATYWQLNDYQKALKLYQVGLSEILEFKNNNLDGNPTIEQLKYLEFKIYVLTILQDKAATLLEYSTHTKNKTKILLQAQKTAQIASKLIDYMRQEHQATESKYFWRDKTRPIYESAIETCLLLKDYEKAFYFFEKSRSVMLNDKLNEMSAKQKLSVEDQKKEKEFISKILDLNANIEKEKDVKKIEELKAKQSDLTESQSQFIKSLETKNPAYYQMKYDTNTVSLGQMQAYLKANFKGKPATIVEYFMGNSATYALVVSADKAEIKKLEYDTKLANTFLRLSSQKLNTKSKLDSLNQISLALNNQLIKYLNLQKGHLIISQDGSFLPFEALMKSNKSGDYIIKDYAISYTYSAQFLLKNKSENSFFPNKNFIGFAPVNFTNLASLNGSKKSISTLADHYFFNKKLVEKEASKNNFLSQANNYKIVQLYTHAQADSNDTEPRIFFADSTLKVSELSAENQFKTQLLVLSACKTGVGKLAKGEGILSLARGFSMLGIPATITSLWSVQDADTYKITELFYDFLNKGFSKDEALQMAKNEFISQSENPQSYAWAGMVLVGETEPIGNSQLYLWLIATILTMGILGFLLTKYKNRLN